MGWVTTPAGATVNMPTRKAVARYSHLPCLPWSADGDGKGTFRLHTSSLDALPSNCMDEGRLADYHQASVRLVQALFELLVVPTQDGREADFPYLVSAHDEHRGAVSLVPIR